MYVIRLEEATNKEDYGSKAAMLANLKKAGMPVPKGFVIKPSALELFITRNGLGPRIRSLSQISDRSLSGLQNMEKSIRDMFYEAQLPVDVKNDVLSAYKQLSLSEEVRNADSAALDLISMGRDHERVAVRTSVIRDAENSYAGVLSVFLNVTGEDELWKHIKLAWASLFYPYAALYREKRSISSMPRMSIIMQKMIDTDKSGSMLTKFGNDKLLVEASWGFGNAISFGIVTPDEYLLDKAGSLIEKNISKKLWMFTRNAMNGKTEKIHVPGNRMDIQVLTETELRKLCGLIENLQTPEVGQYIVDWCSSRNRFYIIDAKPGKYEITPSVEESLTGEVLVTGRCASPGIISGKVRVIPGISESDFSGDDIAVSGMSSSNLLLSLPRLNGFITNDGGRLCNFSILSREFNIPSLTATQNAMSVLNNGDNIKLLAEHGKVVSLPPAEFPKPEPQQEFHDAFPSSDLPPPPAEFPQTKPEPQAPFFEQPPEPVQQLPPEPAQEPQQDTFFESSMIDNSPPENNETFQPQQNRRTGIRVYARVSQNTIERIEGVDGLLLSQYAGGSDMVPGTDAFLEQVRSLNGLPIWIHSKTDNEFSGAVELAKRASDSGLGGVFLLVPVTRGIDDIERWKYQVQSTAQMGITIMTPAMALSTETVITQGMGFVNIDLKSMIQLSMGLERPENKIHASVIDMIRKVVERSKEIGAKSCITVESEHISEENIDSLVNTGIDIICVERSMVGNLNSELSKMQNSMQQNGNMGFNNQEMNREESTPNPDPNPSSSFSFLQ